jgi:hypothetical protein
VWQTAQGSDGVKVAYQIYDEDSPDKKYYVRSRKGNEGKQFFGSIEEVLAAEREDIARGAEFNERYLAQHEENPNLHKQMQEAKVAQRQEDIKKQALMKSAVSDALRGQSGEESGDGSFFGNIQRNQSLSRNRGREGNRAIVQANATASPHMYPTDGWSKDERAAIWAITTKTNNANKTHNNGPKLNPIESSNDQLADQVLATLGLDAQEQRNLTSTLQDIRSGKIDSLQAGGSSNSDQLVTAQANQSASTNGDQPNQVQQNKRSLSTASEAESTSVQSNSERQQALVTTQANKQSAKEARLKKIMEMRKPYMGGAASVNGSSDAMVVPPIIPASQVPPPPLP